VNPTRWVVYPLALVIGVIAGVLAHSGVVSGLVALAFALVWLGVSESR
jgi:Na+(H+)/acetate symporter ActP